MNTLMWHMVNYQCEIVIDKQTYYLDFILFRDNIILPIQARLINTERHKGKKIEDPKILGASIEPVLSQHGTKGWK